MSGHRDGLSGRLSRRSESGQENPLFPRDKIRGDISAWEFALNRQPFAEVVRVQENDRGEERRFSTARRSVRQCDVRHLFRSALRRESRTLRMRPDRSMEVQVKRVLVIALTLCSVGLAGCVHPHGVRSPRGAKIIVPAPAVVVPVPVVVEKGPAKHCPPGQAKKGNC